MSSSKGGVYLLKEEDNVNVKIATLFRKIEAIEIQKVNTIKAT